MIAIQPVVNVTFAIPLQSLRHPRSLAALHQRSSYQFSNEYINQLINQKLCACAARKWYLPVLYSTGDDAYLYAVILCVALAIFLFLISSAITKSTSRLLLTGARCGWKVLRFSVTGSPVCITGITSKNRIVWLTQDIYLKIAIITEADIGLIDMKQCVKFKSVSCCHLLRSLFLCLDPHFENLPHQPRGPLPRPISPDCFHFEPSPVKPCQVVTLVSFPPIGTKHFPRYDRCRFPRGRLESWYA